MFACISCQVFLLVNGMIYQITYGTQEVVEHIAFDPVV